MTRFVCGQKCGQKSGQKSGSSPLTNEYLGAVQNEISKHTRVCSYDRRGYGWSDGLRAKQ